MHDETEDPLDVSNWYRKVYALCHAKLISPSDAEDATQETFIRALAQREKLGAIKNLGGWLRTIARNVCVDTIRRNRIRETVSDCVDVLPSSSIGDGPHGDADDEPMRQLAIMIRDLPEPLREVILLHYYEEMTYDQMAAWLNVARSTVNDRLSRARSILKRQLVADGSVR